MSKGNHKQHSKPDGHGKPKVIIPFRLPVPPHEADKPVELKPVPKEVFTTPAVKDEFCVKAKITAIGEHFWGGGLFYHIEALDGQNLLDLLREGQELEIHKKA
jgi:hypothetical protein